MTTNSFDAWNYRQDSGYAAGSLDLVGYSVEAADGSIGKIDEASAEVSSSYLVVDTGPWIFGKKVMLPAGVVTRVDAQEEKVYVTRTKDEIKDAPEYDDERRDDMTYRDKLGSYYGGTGYTV
ncbi:PRC-barrel domain-containing protein [Pilimelia columellifera]|uniref:PRC-barrel domain containing protein n=1 Tax=Pilimelia columellifera subsp. columellifera TaxID=706583 RepID=A0ABP6ADE1_9ACTN